VERVAELVKTNAAAAEKAAAELAKVRAEAAAQLAALRAEFKAELKAEVAAVKREYTFYGKEEFIDRTLRRQLVCTWMFFV
jgi:hypothetical protein